MHSPSRIGKLSAVFDPIYTPRDSGILDFKMFLDGKWLSLDQTVDVHSPIDDAIIASVPSSSTKEAEQAVDSSYNNWKAIRTIPAVEKLEIFRTARDLLLENVESFTTILVHEAGKPRSNAEGEVKATAERLKLTPDEYGKIRGEHIPGDWSEETVGSSADVLREPLGVVLAIAPFNYPLYITATKVIPALLAGNSVVVKTSSKDPLSFLLFSHVIELAGIPKGTLNVITVAALSENIWRQARRLACSRSQEAPKLERGFHKSLDSNDYIWSWVAKAQQ